MSTEKPTFTKKERDLIRLYFVDLFGDAVSIHKGFSLRRWTKGPNKGQPRIRPAVQSMLDRGLVTVVDPGTELLRVLFTDAGLQALVEMADDVQAFQPRERYSHLLTEIAELRGSSDG
jgi:hypothetical protein